MNNDILHLTLKRKWFEMIRKGIKKEEYREVKPYWTRRLIDFTQDIKHWRSYKKVSFKNGYLKKAPSILVEFKSVNIGEGLTEWGAVKGVDYFIIKLGDILEETY